ncbi:CDP-diacylglycerol--glycerol-3-phosphate 3-phosphatidyltransferase [Beggiatoa leptomitoformis]|uniref:CDP-diacylglycerol--glycerol-3-phosphate 3-phosphatidyltransferase n=1 Tax=Beggiatoa leptomitoformis TaxID=288004 RepID=A0A2N9YB63_9GAMM|nr:CDP-diacylglycerol--glycerol-3-phosphate 3-phosphatidyltransferase [Beggiatoa leptomitoformis]ALG66917.1 CDP-diacylglycerol--glycerol-3-phosphate 3-phosphatidyltransferase [Beggiatoa leptomitoformis]AUI67717.1 CDP-diacylglycerol--glycerol-3-phosphate 3-phosphatidyltransferase [Beggiatoa leptomitoformis]
MTTPNALTLLRIVLIPLFIGACYLPGTWANELTTFIFALAAITDWFDGYLARRWNQLSAFGAFLDPVADKLMVAVALVFLVEANPSPWMSIPSAIIIGREITISALREWMAELGQRATVAVSYIGKVKTTAQMLSITLLLYREPLWDFPIYYAGFVLLYIAAVLTIWSMLVYLRAALPLLLKDGL